MKYLQFCHVINKTRCWISTCTYLLTLFHLIKVLLLRTDALRVTTTVLLPAALQDVEKTHLKSKHKASQCFLGLISSVFMREFSCFISISGDHQSHNWSKKRPQLLKKILPWDICVFSDLASVVNAEPTAVLWDMLALADESVPKDVKEPPALKEIIQL